MQNEYSWRFLYAIFFLKAIWNIDLAAASATELAAIFEHNFVSGALTFRIKANFYNAYFLLRNMVRIRFGSKCQCIREKSLLHFCYGRLWSLFTYGRFCVKENRIPLRLRNW